MTSEDFIATLFIPNIGKYLCSVILCLIINYVFFRKKLRSIIDPLLIGMISFTLACSVSVFLYLCGVVNNEIFTYFCISSLILLICIWKFIPDRDIRIVSITIIYKSHFYKFFFLICISIFLFTSLYSMYINGIPLFNESRFSQNVDNSTGILGLLYRFKSAVGLYSVLYSFYLIRNADRNKGCVFMVILIVLSFLSGSKGFILSFVSAYFFYCIFYEGIKPKIKKVYIVILISTPIATIVLGGLASGGFDSIIFLAYRFLAYGDTYWNALPYDVINNIRIQSPIANMTYMFWGPFRHLLGFSSTEAIMTTGGSLLFEENYKFYPEAGAPNSPITIISWIYYKWSGLLLVSFLGILSFSCYYRIFKNVPRTLYSCCFRAMICSLSLSCLGDIYLLFNYLFNLLLFSVIFYISKCVYRLNSRKVYG